MTTVSEVAPNVFRISTYVPEADLEFGQFLIRDDEPLLFETGMKALFPAVRDAVAKLLDPATIRWIAFSHFESDECGSLNEWLSAAPHAQPACSLVGAVVSVNDFAIRPARPLAISAYTARAPLLGSRDALRGGRRHALLHGLDAAKRRAPAARRR